MGFRLRVLALPVAAVVITAACIYATVRPHPEPSPTDSARGKRFAPLFELTDENMEQIRLQRYIGRHRIVVVFFDGTKSLEKTPILLTIRRRFTELESADIKVLAVSTALPQDYRKAIDRIGKFPFPLLSDPTRQVHQEWGRNREEIAMPGVFLIDRAGRLEWSGEFPLPLSDPESELERILND